MKKRTKLTKEDRATIARLRSTGMRAEKIAEKYNCCVSSVYVISRQYKEMSYHIPIDPVGYNDIGIYIVTILNAHRVTVASLYREIEASKSSIYRWMKERDGYTLSVGRLIEIATYLSSLDNENPIKHVLEMIKRDPRLIESYKKWKS